LGPATSLVLALVVVTLAAAECYAVIRRAGYHPATLLGLVATGALMIAVYVKGERAVPLVLALTVIFSMLWYLCGVVRARPTINVAATLLGFMWVGVLGSFAGLLLDPHVFPNRHGVAYLVGAVLATVGYDVGGFAVGSVAGKHPLAPVISPHKTWEGLIGGMAGSFLVSFVIVSQIHPWTFSRAAALGIVVAVVAPLGDLCESMIKRDIGVKDMGNLLPGHGGVLDRVDALLFVLPATYYLIQLLKLS
ncbi:MAG: phosphatidate cytidylyltransferase, partial [Acidimicrobiales bacterium]